MPADPLKLDTETADLGGIDEKEKAFIRSMDTDTKVRASMALAIIVLFMALNTAVIWIVWSAFQADLLLVQTKVIQSSDRLITEKVFMSLIGATVVQVGVTLVAITGYLFPKK